MLSAKFIERVVKNLEIKRRRRHSCRYNVIALLRTICLQFLITYNSSSSMESFCSKILLDFQSSSILFRRITFVSTPLEASKSPPRDSFCFIFLRPSVLEIRPFKDRLNFEYLSSFLSRSLVPLAPLSLVTLTYPTAHWRAESAFFPPLSSLASLFTIATTRRAYFREEEVGHAASGDSSAIQVSARLETTRFEAMYLENGSRYRCEKKCLFFGKRARLLCGRVESSNSNQCGSFAIWQIRYVRRK